MGKITRSAGLALLVVGVAAIGYVYRDPLWTIIVSRFPQTAAINDGEQDEPDEASDAPEMIELSDAARKNLGLVVGPVELSDYERVLELPGVVSELPGRSSVTVTTTVHGVVRWIHAVPGQAVRPGEALFDLQLTGEALATAQSALLSTLQDIEVTEAEVARVRPLAKTQAVPRNTLTKLEYDLKRLEALRSVRMQELLVRGLGPEQVDQIISTSTLIRELTVRVPPASIVEADAGSLTAASFRNGDQDDDPRPSGTIPVMSAVSAAAPGQSDEKADWPYTLENLNVHPGKLVQPGQDLCDLAYHATLLIEGQAYENEIATIGRVQAQGWGVTAVFGLDHDNLMRRPELQLLYTDNHVDQVSQTFRFYLPLTNEVAADRETASGRVYRTWLFKPGQKCHLLVPIQQYTGRIVLPRDAVVIEAQEAFVFRQNGRFFERVRVHVEHVRRRDHEKRESDQPASKQPLADSRQVVVAFDGAVFPGDVIALNNAYQLHLAIRRAGGASAGHHHGHEH